MVCEYLVRKGKRVYCMAYGSLEEASSDKILECESNFGACFERAKEVKERDQREKKGIADYFNLGD